MMVARVRYFTDLFYSGNCAGVDEDQGLNLNFLKKV